MHLEEKGKIRFVQMAVTLPLLAIVSEGIRTSSEGKWILFSLLFYFSENISCFFFFCLYGVIKNESFLKPFANQQH